MLSNYFKVIAFIESVLNAFIVLILNLKNIGTRQHLPANQSDVLHIIGTGPSLSSDFPRLLQSRKGASCMAVNTFVLQEMYGLIQPEFYVLFDPVYFQPSQLERINREKESLLKALVQHTHWEMVLLMPLMAKNSEFCQQLRRQCPTIRPVFLKNIPVIGGMTSVNLWLFRRGLANPLYQNVLVACIYIALKMNHRSVQLWGADHSWLPNLQVMPDNSLVLVDKHIDHSDTDTIKITTETGADQQLHVFIHQLAAMFREYHVLRRFADSLSIPIVNNTRSSFIDAFEKSEPRISSVADSINK